MTSNQEGSMSEIQAYNESSKVITEFNSDQQTLIAQLGYGDIPQNHLAVFFLRAKALGLNPQDPSQITIIPRNSRNGGKTYTVQVGIQGLRTGARNVCRRAGEKYSEGEWLYAGQDGQWREIWSVEKDGYPVAAKVAVTRGDQKFSHVVMWEEAAQMYNGKPQALWASRPAFMLGKNAAAGAFRKAFPDHMSDVYVDGEFDREPAYMTATRKPAPKSLKAALAPAKKEEPAPEPVGEQEPVDDPLTSILADIAAVESRDALTGVMAVAQGQLSEEEYAEAQAQGMKRWEELDEQ